MQMQPTAGFLDLNQWISKLSDPNYREVLVDALAEIEGVLPEIVSEIYVALFLDVYGSWYEENQDRFRPYAIATRRGRSLANEDRFAAVLIDEIPYEYPPFHRLLQKHPLPLVFAVLILYEIDSPSGSLVTALKAHARLLKGRTRDTSEKVAKLAIGKILRHLSPSLRAVRDIAASRSLGGKRNAAMLREKNRERNERICYEARRLSAMHPQRAIAGMLAPRFSLTPRQIRSILKCCKKREMR